MQDFLHKPAAEQPQQIQNRQEHQYRKDGLARGGAERFDIAVKIRPQRFVRKAVDQKQNDNQGQGEPLDKPIKSVSFQFLCHTTRMKGFFKSRKTAKRLSYPKMFAE